MNKRIKKKNLFIRNKKHPFYGMKKGCYEVIIEDTNIHQDIFDEKVIQELFKNNQKIYLCKKKIGTQDYWWIATYKNKFKQLQVPRVGTSVNKEIEKLIREFYVNH